MFGRGDLGDREWPAGMGERAMSPELEEFRQHVLSLP
jgi:hypothetical protein